jgi:hypothetical protein
MNINKFIASGIYLFLFLVPFRLLFFTDEWASSMKHILLLLSCVIGFIVAFAIGTNEPFGKKKPVAQKRQDFSDRTHRQAA